MKKEKNQIDQMIILMITRLSITKEINLKIEDGLLLSRIFFLTKFKIKIKQI